MGADAGARTRACATDRPGIVRRAHHCGRAGDERRRRPCSIYFRHEEKSVPASRAQHASVDVSPPRWRPRHSARAPRGRPLASSDRPSARRAMRVAAGLPALRVAPRARRAARRTRATPDGTSADILSPLAAGVSATRASRAALADPAPPLAPRPPSRATRARLDPPPRRRRLRGRRFARGGEHGRGGAETVGRAPRPAARPPAPAATRLGRLPSSSGLDADASPPPRARTPSSFTLAALDPRASPRLRAIFLPAGYPRA